MSISFDNVLTNSTATSVSPSTGSLTLAASANMAVICVFIGGTDTVSIVNSVTVGGVSATLRASVAGSAGSYSACGIWTLASPSTGAQTVNINFTPGNIRGFVALSYIGADNGFDQTNNGTFGSGTSGTATLSGVAANAWAISCSENSNANPTAGTGLTLRGTQFGGAGAGDSNGVVSGTANQTYNFGGTGTGNFCIVSIAPPAGSHLLNLMGVGR